MPDSKRSHDPDELARLGMDYFNTSVRAALRPEDDGKYVAIDVGTGDFEIDADDYIAVHRLRDRRPSADVWLERAGQPTAYKLRGGR